MNNKIIYLIFLFISIITLSGCGSKNEVITTCTKTSNTSITEYRGNQTYKIHAVKKVPNKILITETITVNNSKKVDEMLALEKEVYKNLNDTYGGHTYSVSKQGNIISLTATIDFEKINQAIFIKDNPILEEYLDRKGNITTEGLIKLYTENEFICSEN